MEMMREMSILASIRHPNVVSVREVVLDSTQMFMVMELVDFDLGISTELVPSPLRPVLLVSVSSLPPERATAP